MPAGYDSQYLIETVGDALAKGVAATIAAQPADPVEHLATWLLRCNPGGVWTGVRMRGRLRACTCACTTRNTPFVDEHHARMMNTPRRSHAHRPIVMRAVLPSELCGRTTLA